MPDILNRFKCCYKARSWESLLPTEPALPWPGLVRRPTRIYGGNYRLDVRSQKPQPAVQQGLVFGVYHQPDSHCNVGVPSVRTQKT